MKCVDHTHNLQEICTREIHDWKRAWIDQSHDLALIFHECLDVLRTHEHYAHNTLLLSFDTMFWMCVCVSKTMVIDLDALSSLGALSCTNSMSLQLLAISQLYFYHPLTSCLYPLTIEQCLLWNNTLRCGWAWYLLISWDHASIVLTTLFFFLLILCFGCVCVCVCVSNAMVLVLDALSSPGALLHRNSMSLQPLLLANLTSSILSFLLLYLVIMEWCLLWNNISHHAIECFSMTFVA